jgi:hypothetical protein
MESITGSGRLVYSCRYEVILQSIPFAAVPVKEVVIMYTRCYVYHRKALQEPSFSF